MNIGTLIKGMGLGAGLMYLWDPISGRRRRSLVLDQWDHAVHCTQDYLDKAQRDATNRAAGLGAQASSLVRGDCADDRVVTARVRSKLGRHCSHPHAIDVEAHDGRVVLSGPVLESEVGDLLKVICSVTGVRGVENRLEIHRQAGKLSALQGGGGERASEAWNPSTRVASQLAGAALMGNCLASNTLTSKLLGAVGLGLFVRASTNRSLGQLIGTEPSPQAVRFQRTVSIDAPVEKVWDFLSDFEEVARFLPMVKKVQNLGDGRYLWALNLPGGQTLEIEEQVTESVPQERLSWQSVDDRPVSYEGTVLLKSAGENSTRVHVCFDYMPPGGPLGAALGSMLGMDVKSQFQEAVMRIKPFLEHGQMPHDAGASGAADGSRVPAAQQGAMPAKGAHQLKSQQEPNEHQERLERLSQMGQSGPAASQQQATPPSSAPQPVRDEPTGQGHLAPSGQEASSDQSASLPPDQISRVHAEMQPNPNEPERGRLG